MAKIIRLTETDIERLVKKIIKEEEITEVGSSEFTDRINVPTKSNNTLTAAIAKLKGKRHIVVIDKQGRVQGYGPVITPDMDRTKICSIAEKLVAGWEEEVSMNEVDQHFDEVKPLTFCSK
jgi:hypothetical protein